MGGDRATASRRSISKTDATEMSNRFCLRCHRRDRALQRPVSPLLTAPKAGGTSRPGLPLPINWGWFYLTIVLDD
jgi:hypothetical protein